jgi:hypothetical protein
MARAKEATYSKHVCAFGNNLWLICKFEHHMFCLLCICVQYICAVLQIRVCTRTLLYTCGLMNKLDHSQAYITSLLAGLQLLYLSHRRKAACSYLSHRCTLYLLGKTHLPVSQVYSLLSRQHPTTCLTGVHSPC